MHVVFGIRVSVVVPVVSRPPEGPALSRRGAEHREGELGGARRVERPVREVAVVEARDREIVVICRSGNRSERARLLMDDLGFGEVYDVEGGIVAWESAGLPLA